jgi:hypothetical protein
VTPEPPAPSPAIASPPASAPEPSAAPVPAPALSEVVPSERPAPRLEVKAPTPAKAATVGAVSRDPRSSARRSERRDVADQASTPGGDGTAIIDWLLKGRSGD